MKGLALAVLLCASAHALAQTPGPTLANRMHTFAPPSTREATVAFFTRVFDAKLMVLSSSPDVVAFAFADGSALSIEFTSAALTMEQARRGTWIELRTQDVPALQRRILAAGVPRLHVPGSPLFYFQTPAGQVIRLASVR